MARAHRLSRLVEPRPPTVTDVADLRTAAASVPDLCSLSASGHNSHWIPMRRATEDPDGTWATVVSVHDDGPLLELDTGGELRLYHHAMAAHGHALAQGPRVFWQPRWGWLWSAGLGISAVGLSGWRPCAPRRARPRPAGRLRPTLPGVPGPLDCVVEDRGHRSRPVARTLLRTSDELQPTRVLRVDDDGVRLEGVPGTWWTHDLARLAALVAAVGPEGAWQPAELVLGLPDGAGFLPVPLLPEDGGREPCRGAGGELLHPPGSVTPR